MKMLGALLIILSCSWFGFAISASYIRQKHDLRKIMRILTFMQCELKYRMTSLPGICTAAAQQTGGQLRKTFMIMASELEQRIAPDAGSCMNYALSCGKEYPVRIRRVLNLLGQSLGKFDLDGQLVGIDEVKHVCQSELEYIEQNMEDRIRNYRTLGICAGIALAVLLI